MTDCIHRSQNIDGDAGSGSSVSPAVQAIKLTKHFGRRTGVHGLTFSIGAGELYALLGENGAGKTTTINILTTLLSPSEGEFFLCGHHGIKDPERSKGVFGVVSQDLALYCELTAFENLRFMADLYGIRRDKAMLRIDALLRQCGLFDRRHDRAGEFSNGMQRKLAIAMAILSEPPILFMDEPTVGLDPYSRHQIWHMLKELRAKGVTILLTTHYLEEAELLADRIGVIRQGKLVAEGTIDELRRKIQAIRSIAIQLVGTMDAEQLKVKMESFRLRAPGKASRKAPMVDYDLVHNTVLFTQPEGVALIDYLSLVLDWLKSEHILFSRLTTSEPNLEEVFLALTAESASVVSDAPL